MTDETIKVGDKVLFPRGMFGPWPGKVRRIRTLTRRFTFGARKELVADVSFTRANGSFGKATVPFTSLQPIPKETPRPPAK